MPNTPALLGEGASGYCLGPNARDRRRGDRPACLDSVGRAFRVPESLLDAVTGLSGSGPAFVYMIIEALSDGGVRVGLPRDVATALAAQTVLGAARMVLETGLHPGVLKDQVTSPGGTTIAGLHALERGGLRAALIDAVEAADPPLGRTGRPSPRSESDQIDIRANNLLCNQAFHSPWQYSSHRTIVARVNGKPELRELAETIVSNRLRRSNVANMQDAKCAEQACL